MSTCGAITAVNVPGWRVIPLRSSISMAPDHYRNCTDNAGVRGVKVAPAASPPPETGPGTVCHGVRPRRSPASIISHSVPQAERHGAGRMVHLDCMHGMIAGYVASPKGQEAMRNFLSSPEGQRAIDAYLATPDGQRMACLVL